MTLPIFDALYQAFHKIDAGPLLLHTDLFRCGIWQGINNRQQAYLLGEELLLYALNGRTALIPTFNYDFCRTGVYDVDQCSSQVGALSNYLRQKYRNTRTQTPVFHFCQLNTPTFSLSAASNCFGDTSTFAELVAQEGSIGFLGASFSSNTFLHHVEELADVGYRQHKLFPGTVKNKDRTTPVTLTYRVRPLDPPDSVVYDWERLESDLHKQGILRATQLGTVRFQTLRASSLLEFWLQQLRRDPLYLLEKC